jgi:RNA polymerase sigma-70 factor (ECF subfamily)
LDGALKPHLRLSALVRENFDYVWRLLRRLGLSRADADDAAQLVFIVLSQKLGDVTRGKERAFLYGTAVKIAWRSRRTLERRREELSGTLESGEAPLPNPEALCQQREARETLDVILGAMALEMRAVFVLFEFEGASLGEIASILEIPRGTVASRLRRAREEFERRVDKLEKANQRRNGR